jgi:hypothetical protein
MLPPISGMPPAADSFSHHCKLWDSNPILSGFDSLIVYNDFTATLLNGLSQSGFSGAIPIMQGSSVSGFKGFTTGGKVAGTIFDTGRKRSDFDIAIADPILLDSLVGEFGPKILRSQKTRTDAFEIQDFMEIGLLNRETGGKLLEMVNHRSIGFMSYKTQEGALFGRTTTNSIIMRPR